MANQLFQNMVNFNASSKEEIRWFQVQKKIKFIEEKVPFSFMKEFYAKVFAPSLPMPKF